MQKLRRTPEFKEQALSKARQRGSRTLEDVAAELNMPLHNGSPMKAEALHGDHAAIGRGDQPQPPLGEQ